MVTDFQQRIIKLCAEYSLLGLDLERANDPEDLFEEAKIYLSTPAHSTVGPEGIELAKMFKKDYCKAVYGEYPEVEGDFDAYCIIYNRIRDEEWTEADVEKRKKMLQFFRYQEV